MAILFVGLTMLLAGCGEAEYIDLTGDVTAATETDSGWEIEVTLAADRSVADHVWQNVIVTGHGYQGTQLCQVEIESIREDETVTRTLRCDQEPVFITVRSDRVGGPVDEPHKRGFGEWVYRDDGTDSYVQTQSLALTDIRDGVPQYRELPQLTGGVSEFEVYANGYAQCKLITNGVSPDDLDGERPWLQHNLTGRQYLGNATVRVERGIPIKDSTRSALTPSSLPKNNATAGLRQIIDAYSSQPTTTSVDSDQYTFVETRPGEADDSSPVVVYRYEAGLKGLTSLHRALLSADESVNNSATIGPDTVVDIANRSDVQRATASEMAAKTPGIDCANTGRAILSEPVDSTATVTYALQVDGEPWTVTIVSEYRANSA